MPIHGKADEEIDATFGGVLVVTFQDECVKDINALRILELVSSYNYEPYCDRLVLRPL